MPCILTFELKILCLILALCIDFAFSLVVNRYLTRFRLIYRNFAKLPTISSSCLRDN